MSATDQLTDQVMKLAIDYAKECAINKTLREEIAYLRKLVEGNLPPPPNEGSTK